MFGCIKSSTDEWSREDCFGIEGTRCRAAGSLYAV